MFFGLMTEAFPTHLISWVVGHAIHSGVALPVFSIISFFITIRTDWWLGHTIHPGVALPVKVENREGLSPSLLCNRAHDWGYPY